MLFLAIRKGREIFESIRQEIQEFLGLSVVCSFLLMHLEMKNSSHSKCQHLEISLEQQTGIEATFMFVLQNTSLFSLLCIVFISEFQCMQIF